MATILQAPLMTDFLYPFLLLFFLVFAILEKTKILGEDVKTTNALVSLVVALIFVAAIFPKLMATNLILFMSVGLVIIFVGLMMWGFITGEKPTPGGKWKSFYAVILFIAIFFAVIWAAGILTPFINGAERFMMFLFGSSWSGSFWTNALIVAFIAGAIAIALKAKGATK